ncbi:hypothetical protein [Streptomyces macrosporus]|uniref:Uncharacterized protein n=1 Tax=Streptomyces macrosporus TaxID=44032 RepID=A0ABP5XPC2_9ACTN
MLEIGLHGLAFALTVIVIAGLKKGGKTIPAPASLAAGIALGYAYQHAGDPWSIVAEKAVELNAQIGDEFGAVPAAVAVALLGWWHFARPGLLGSITLGFLALNAASAATDLWRKAVSIIGSLLTVITG